MSKLDSIHVKCARWRRRSLGVVALGVGFSLPGISQADCASDCSGQYEAAVNACQATDPDPNSPNAIQSCMDQAQRSYGACSAQCTESTNDEQG